MHDRTVGKVFKIDWKMRTLISTGTGICGGSAIAALTPVIEADESAVTYSIAATFAFDILPSYLSFCFFPS